MNDGLSSHPSVHDWTPWVFMKLEWGPYTDNGLGLLLTINFNQHHLDVLGGRVWFAFRSCLLTVSPSNATVPYSSRWPMKPLEVKCKVKRSLVNSIKEKKTESVAAGADFENSVPSLDFSFEGEVVKDGSASTKDEFHHEFWQTQTKGSEVKPYWDFRASDYDKWLKGGWSDKQTWTP